jgi:Uma2 family endonuclease
MSPAGPNHGDVAITIGFFVKAFVRERKLGKVYAAETGFIIARNPDSVRAPDVAFVKKDRVHLTPKRGFFPGPPDLAVEVLSPDDSASEVMAKVQDWLNAGTNEVWVVDPERKVISINRVDRPARLLNEPDELTCETLLPGFRVLVAEIFE